MAKRKKKQICEEMAPWMITFSDVMTLMLTFFVLLVSMSKIDERRKLVVLGSIVGAFGWGQSEDVMATQPTKRTVDPGTFEGVDDLASLKPMLWEDVNQDLNFQSDRFVQILSINAELLYAPGQTGLTERGRTLLDRMLPVLLQLDHPLLIAGHTGSLREELGVEYRSGDGDRIPDLSWRISLNRALAVYSYLLDQGMDPAMLRVEGFGRFRPLYNTNDPEMRSWNRRVDLVLDSRNQPDRALEVERVVRELTPEVRPDTYDVDGFEFSLPDPVAPE
ncbi:MAG: flagellar motor protein MotB [Desulfovibrio sp.]|jgi:chemotaxis protein MotB|nr:flagellar motor protein MotB [Desulfovibrio sp.]